MTFLCKLQNNTFLLIVISIIVSILLSVILLYQDNVINNDGVTYLVSAGYIKEGNWHQALQVYNWPFYPWLIAISSKIGRASCRERV